jgi:crossover junction endodeoxyribonuclease RuvC
MEKNKYIELIIGIDPSLSETGVVGIRGNKIEFSHLIKTKKTGDTPLKELDRLRDIVLEVVYLLDKYKPKVVVMESIAMMARNTTALAQLCGLNYMLRDVCYRNYTTYMASPTGLKKFITGKGNSAKELMLLETYKRYKASFENNNLCDAFGLAKIGEALITPDLKLTQPQQEVIVVIKKQYASQD